MHCPRAFVKTTCMASTNLQSQAHTGSYYAASVNDVTDFAPLLGEQTADVCVVGAGFTGVSTALHLAERGYNVHVVEANRVEMSVIDDGVASVSIMLLGMGAMVGDSSICSIQRILVNLAV